MAFRYKNQNFFFPASLKEITLGRRIAFYEQHGKVLDEMAGKIEALKDEFDKEAETNIWHLELALRTFSFYTGIELDEVRHIDIASLLHIYYTEIQPLMAQELNIALQQEYEFNGEKWYIAPVELFASSKMELSEFIYPKEICRQMNLVGKGKWDSLPYLCAVYLRKENEAFDESFVAENSERLRLMQTLPLDIAIAVGFFLSSTLNFYTTISPSSIRKDQQEVSIQQNTSTNGDG